MIIHGGDVYRNKVKYDFSVNLNPLGTPECVMAALQESVGICGIYPDIKAEKLKCDVSKQLFVPKEYLLFGNGASELFMAIVHGIKPSKILIPVPSFYGYEYVAEASGGEIIYYYMKSETGFSLEQDFYGMLTEDIDLLFIANPNNPTGTLLDKKVVREILCHCRDKGIYVVLDECFIDFTCDGFSALSDIEDFENLIIIRAYTKIFSIPGVRLGYLICKNQKIIDKISGQLPEWNISSFAQVAGCVCAKQKDFIKETQKFLRVERQFLEGKLRQKGINVVSAGANFILIYSDKPLYKMLCQKGILIRDCSNFRGLCGGFYRIAVKGREENEILINNLYKIQNGKEGI